MCFTYKGDGISTAGTHDPSPDGPHGENMVVTGLTGISSCLSFNNYHLIMCLFLVYSLIYFHSNLVE